ncbi:hypothetical protein C1J03_12360 [Sulfitobacter sp. SK012]|uniref:hypothetical protein n=1 Tax=Sulfitobacter sp. SK012 TaxID=1389005 RepID=UPI000E0BB029|nr:hypothetical protein [Sulfitobacter sp. SK012]AXI46744.1 hypothetical protein C1J03_12360 [Sulfitobacter sp. SK012]
MTGNPKAVSDSELRAYLDGAADLEVTQKVDTALGQDQTVQARLHALDETVPLLKKGFDLDELDAPEMPTYLRTPTAHVRSRAMLPLAIAASFVLGVGVTSLLQPKSDWVDSVASYQALYVTQTLAGNAQAVPVTDGVLANAKAALDVDLGAATKIDGLLFKRAQMLAIKGKPLIQMAYLDENGTPFVFCVTRVDGANKPPQTSINHELAATSWVQDGIGYVLIGGENKAQVSDLAKVLTLSL